VAIEINKMQRRFLWSSKHDTKASVLVKWDVVQRPKKEGGLGVGDLVIRNAALLFKWWWRFACEEGAIWRSVIQSIYEEDNALLPARSQSNLSGPWKAIKQIAVEESGVSKAFFKNLSVRLGEGTRVTFWLDVWVDVKPLKVIFPMLFPLSMQQNELVANMGWFEGPIWRWTSAWARELTSEEQAQLDALQVVPQKFHPQRNVKDQILWDKKENFTARALVTEAGKISNGNVAVDNLTSTVWMNVAPPKVEFMAWLALLGKLNTREMLVRKGIIPAEANICTFCSEHSESGDHLLMGCAFSWNVWKCIAEELGMKIEAQQTFRQFYDWFMTRRTSNRVRKRFFILTFFATTWSIWNKRNMMVFHNQSYDHHSLCHTIKWRIGIWSKAWKEDIQYTTEELVRNFNCIPRLFA